MKKSILTLIFILAICGSSISQGVSVELSVSWQRGDFAIEGKKNSYRYPLPENNLP